MVNSIEVFIHQVLGSNHLTQDSYINICDKNIGIKSYNNITSVVEYKRINKIIRKKDSITYTVNTLNNSIKVTKEHKFLIKLEKSPFYATITEILKIKGNIKVLTNTSDWETITSIIKNKIREEIYDLEVQDNSNLFTNNILSHNSMGGAITTGGKAIKFYADARWKVWKQNDKVNELNKTTIDVIKNKISSPFGQAKLNILWGVGFDTIGEILDYTVEFGLVKQSGSWFSYGDTKLGQGFEGVKVMLKDNPELLEELTDKVMANLSIPTIIAIE